MAQPGFTSIGLGTSETASADASTQAPTRVQLSRARGWRKPNNTVVVARPSIWGNPFVVGKHGTREECLEKYRACVATFPVSKRHIELWRSAGGNTSVLMLLASRKIEQLRGKNLACWCKSSDACHADVLLELANEEVSA